MKSQISDGYHTFEELYDHRHALFRALMLSNIDISWKSIQHDDGSSLHGWFVAGIHLATGDITYHMPIALWSSLDKIRTLDNSPAWDGHNSDDVIGRLMKL